MASSRTAASDSASRSGETADEILAQISDADMDALAEALARLLISAARSGGRARRTVSSDTKSAAPADVERRSWHGSGQGARRREIR